MSVEDQQQADGVNTTTKEDNLDLKRKESHASQDSQTATDYINAQLQLEADAREILPYSFDSCTYTLGSLRQTVFACLTCNPPPASAAQVYNPAGVCYSCSISCHGEHTLVELFSRRNFQCDCGTTRFSSTPCTLRADANTGSKGVQGEPAAKTNTYNQNYQNRFCGCHEDYDAHQERGTMFQCIGLGTVETGGCGEDWWHPECIMGLPRDWHKSVPAKQEDNRSGEPKADEILPSDAVDEATEEAPVPPGFPDEDDFETFICYKCVESNPWIKKYAGAPGFLPAVFKKDASNGTISASTEPQPEISRKRKASEEPENDQESVPSKRVKDESESEPKTSDPITQTTTSTSTDPPFPKHKHDNLSSNPSTGVLSLFLQETFRDNLCHCPSCFRSLVPHPQLLEEEETYEPPLSQSSVANDPTHSARSQGTGSILDRGEAALNTMDRVKAIEGVMVYNHLKDKVKEFLKPYAESGQAVGAEDIKAYFEKLRGDEGGIKEAANGSANGGKEDGGGEEGNGRREQGGY